MSDGMNIKGVGGVRPLSEAERLQKQSDEERLKKTDSNIEPSDVVEISPGAREALKTIESQPLAPPKSEEITLDEMRLLAEGWYSFGFAKAYEAVDGMQV